MAPSLMWKQPVFLFSPACRFLLLRCPCACFHMVAVEKQCLLQLMCKTVSLSSLTLLLRHFVLLSVESKFVLSAQLNPRKTKWRVWSRFPRRLCTGRAWTVNQLVSGVVSVPRP